MSKAVQKVEIKEQAPAIAEASALISMLERMARDPNVDPARIQQFLKMKQDDEDRISRRAFMAAFSDLQGELPAVARRGKAHNGKAYARFEDLVEAYRPYLVKHCFALSFRTDQQDGSIKITGVLGHKDGHEERTSIVLPMDKTGNKNDVQAWGSSTSYGKRYVAMTLLGIATEDEDDDGKKAGAGETISTDEVEELRTDIMSTNSDIAAFYAFFGVESLEDMPKAKLGTARNFLKMKKEAINFLKMKKEAIKKAKEQ